MARLLKDLQPGTPVHATDRENVAEIRGVFASGDSRSVHYVLVRWTDSGEETLLDAKEILSIENEGVLLCSERETYRSIPAFDPSANPLMHRLN